MLNEKYIFTTLINTGRSGMRQIECISTGIDNDSTFENIYYFMGIAFYKTITNSDCFDDVVVSKQILNKEILHTVLHYLMVNANLH